MIRKSDECKQEVRVAMRGGDGQVEITNFMDKEEFKGTGRLFANLSIKPGCGIGYHIHDADTEIFYIKNGTALYSDNGTEKTVTAGDVTITPKGTGHSIKNISDETVDVIALIINA
ncbi:MAG: cupin domain-containing protein [Clostridiales bacterium]|nr:cupin domain-containing protein [Clostridiales bacterium]